VYFEPVIASSATARRVFVCDPAQVEEHHDRYGQESEKEDVRVEEQGMADF